MTTKDVNIDDLTYNLLCNRQKKTTNKSFLVKSNKDEIRKTIKETPQYDETKQILKIIKQKLNNKSVRSNKLDTITDNLLMNCLELIKYNLEKSRV